MTMQDIPITPNPCTDAGRLAVSIAGVAHRVEYRVMGSMSYRRDQIVRAQRTSDPYDDVLITPEGVVYAQLGAGPIGHIDFRVPENPDHSGGV